MFQDLNPLKIIEQLSPAEKLVGIVMTILIILLPGILEQFSSENLKFIVLISVILLIFSVAIFASYRNQKIQGVVKVNKDLLKTRKNSDNELKELRERERELLRRENGSLISIANRLKTIKRELDESLNGQEIGRWEAFAIRDKITPLITEIQAKVETTERRLIELAEVEGLLNVSDTADDEMAAWVEQQKKLKAK